MTKTNCIHADQDVWCKNKNIKKSLWGFGARCCIEAGYSHPRACEFKETNKRPELSELPKEKRERIFRSHRMRYSIDTKSPFVTKESLRFFCDNFITLMDRRVNCAVKGTDRHTRAEEQLKAYRFMKEVLTGE